MTTPAVRLQEVSRTFEGSPPVRALCEVELEIGKGESVAIVGPSGSGKSTLLHVLGLLDQPTSGRYDLDGVDVAGMRDSQRAGLRGRSIGFVFQDFHLLRHRTVTENVMTALLYNRVPRRERKARAVTALERVGLDHRKDATPETLSGGERQRVAIARAVVSEPVLLLADEPTGNLDSATGASVLEVFEALQRDGITIVVATHDEAVSGVAGRSVSIVDGVLSEARAGVTP
ncbi:MAG: ABC transporter ATP-binding protein [Actinomycetota bacterium]|nr:ABC transporter ATP-binding protein [Actinomycetota bacterium]